MSELDRHAQAGIAAINERRFDDAVQHFEAALAEAPDRPDMNSALGMAFLHRGDVGSALPFLEAACRLSEAYPDAEHAEMKVHFFTSWATALQMMDRAGEARDVLQRTTARFPAAVEAQVQLGQALLETGEVEAGVAVYRALAEHPALDEERRKAAEAVAGCVRAFLDSGEPASVFLEAHQGSYKAYFDEVAAAQPGWYAEAARMARGPDGESRPYLPDGARPYALIRVDLVDPATGEVGSVYSDREPMIVTVEGLEPLAQIPVLFPWRDQGLDLYVCTRCPWHWLPIVIEIENVDRYGAAVDDAIGAWYLAGYNGDFGDAEAGRFHYISDPEVIGERAVAYTVDLGRAGFEAIADLVRRLRVLGDRVPLGRVLLGGGRLL